MAPVGSRKDGPASPAAEQEGGSAFITSLTDSDILLGRGAPVQRREANRRFRELVWEHKPAYDASGKHVVKDEIARRILDTISARGGRFVRHVETKEERKKLGVPNNISDVWVAIDEDLAREKVKQTLRDAVPYSPSTRKAVTTGKKRKSRSLKQQSPSSKTAVHLDPSSARKKVPNSKPEAAAQSASSSGAALAAREAAAPEVPYPIAALPASQSGEQQVDRHGEEVDDEDHGLSFRLKHPSFRKRDMIRLRRQREQQLQHHQQSETPSESEVSIRSDSELQHGTSSESRRESADDEDLDVKPKARDDNR